MHYGHSRAADRVWLKKEKLRAGLGVGLHHPLTTLITNHGLLPHGVSFARRYYISSVVAWDLDRWVRVDCFKRPIGTVHYLSRMIKPVGHFASQNSTAISMRNVSLFTLRCWIHPANNLTLTWQRTRSNNFAKLVYLEVDHLLESKVSHTRSKSNFVQPNILNESNMCRCKDERPIAHICVYTVRYA